MKKTFALFACLLALAACSDDDDNNAAPSDGDSQNSGTAQTPSDDQTSTSGQTLDLRTFDITWDDVPDDTFADANEAVPTDEAADEYEDFVENVSFESQITITYNESSAAVEGAVDGVTVTADGAYVTVNSTVGSVEYIIKGSTTDGALKIYSDKKFKLTLDNVSLASAKGAAINIQSSKRAYICIAEGTENTLTDADDYTATPDTEDEKACLFAEGKILLAGSGSLTINANYKHGICSDDYLYIHSGVRLTVASAPKDAIHTNDKIVMAGGLVKLTPSGDGLDCEEGNIDIRGGLLKAEISGAAAKAVKAETDISISGGQVILVNTGEAEYDADDQDISSAACIKCGGNFGLANAEVSAKSTGAAGKGINCDGTLSIASGTLKVITTGEQYVYGSLDSSPKGVKADGDLTISGGTILVRATGGEGSEGIESKSTMTVTGGDVSVYTYDDCMNASTAINISGGNIYCHSTGNDGIDSNGSLTISGGLLVAIGTTTPEEAIDSDDGTYLITGGTVFGIGGSAMTQPSSQCTQCVVTYGASASQGTLLSIVKSDGTHLASFTAPRTYNQMTMIYSGSALTQGASYTIYTGGSVEGGNEFYELVTNGTYTAGTSAATFTTSGMVTSAGNGNSNPGGGGPGGRH